LATSIIGASKQKTFLHLVKSCFTVQKYSRTETQRESDMNSIEYSELAGRIQGLSDLVLHTVAQLEMNGLIDGPRLTDDLHQFADRRRIDGPHQESARKTLHELATFLEQARTARQ
jgi:hypothetical protein